MPELPESKKTNPLNALILNNNAQSCLDGAHCKFSAANHPRPLCMECRLSPDAPEWLTSHHWKPVDPRFKNRKLEAEKRESKRKKAIDRAKARASKDKSIQARNRAAERAERRTERSIIKATKNSGRVNRDGDHVFAEDITLDTKLQSNADNPTVHLHELDTIRADAARAGKRLGGLVLRNKHGRGIVVIDERDLGKLVSGS